MTRYLAKCLPQHSGPAAWNSILGEQQAAQSFVGDLTADIVIIGGGFAGLSAARRALQLEPKSKIVLLEAGRLAEGAAGRNSGFMIDLPHDLASDDYAGAAAESDLRLTQLNRQAINFGADAVEEYGIDRNFFDPAGKVNGAATSQGEQHNDSYASHLHSLNEPHEILDAQSMADLTGSRHYRSGLFTPGSVMLQPAGYIRAFGVGLSQKISTYENSPVTGFEKIGQDWKVVTREGTVTAPRIILANNGHLESFGVAKGRLMQVFLYASMTEELSLDHSDKLGGASRWGVTPSDPMGTTMRRIDTGQGGNRIVTRTCATFNPEMKVWDRDVARSGRVHRAKFDERFPQLNDVKMEHVWAGHLCLSRNGVGITRQIDDGLFSACVQNGLGTTRGTLAGMAAAEMACGHQSEVTRHFENEAEPTKLPPRPFSTLGANAYLRWKEWRAGAE